jgi:protease I
MSLAGKKVGVLVENSYQELELWYPILRFREAGTEVKIIGPEAKKTYTSKYGYPAIADLSADKVNPSEFDAIIIPGGYAPDVMRTHKEMVNLVRDAFNKGKVVAAICHAGWMLASAGILEGKKATCYVAIKDDVINAGAKYLDQEVVRDGNLITSRKPDDLPAFCKTIIEALNEK